ncbi:MAG: amidohydrolase family protein [Balneolales bacterium]
MQSEKSEFDILILNGRVLDGMGNPWYYADIGITDDRIQFVGDLKHAAGREVINAMGLTIAPGFIDVHTHATNGLQSKELSSAKSILAQGVTSVVVNHDGGGPVNLAEQESRLMAYGLGVNVIPFVPHGSVRSEIMNRDNRKPTSSELNEMKSLVRQGMEFGAFGLSTGLFYAPGSFSETSEIIELAKVVAEFDGIHVSHIRDEADYNIGVVAAVDEIIRISEEAVLPGVVSHIKTLGPRVWGYSSALVHRINSARQNGIEVYADQYPYAASATSLSGALIPSNAHEGGLGALRSRLNDENALIWIRQGITDNLDRRGGADRILFRRFQQDESIEGKTLQNVADSLGTNPVDLTVELIKIGSPDIISVNMHDDDVNFLMQQSWTMTSSDGDLTSIGDGVPHPRNYGPFPRKIKKYVIEDKVITLENAIRSMTSLPASVLRLNERGAIRQGAVADLAIFDLDQIKDVATYTDPHHYSEGMVHVLVGGKFGIKNAEFTGELNGRVLKKDHASIAFTTCPCTSVSRKSRPW